MRTRQRGAGKAGLAALGVVFGDIGTSPLYAVSLLFLNRRDTLTPERIMGSISLVLWLLVIVVAVKYAVLALRADNDGEGGVFALYGLLNKVSGGNRFALGWALLLGAGLLLGDGMITPAISVLSAVEGLEVAMPHLAGAVLPVTLALLTVLFRVQRRGTGRLGMVFGPVMLVWFVAIATMGAWQVAHHPQILRALSPACGIRLLAGSDLASALRVLGAVILAVTGCEAMYADMGHFGARAIRGSWFVVVLPALLLNYLGQGAWLLGSPGTTVAGVLFRMVPSVLALPTVMLATLATIIASQALISGTFSVVAQAIKLGFFPHLPILHTDQAHVGEVYVPFFNWLLFVGCVALVLAFRSSDALGAAYGLAESGLMLVTSLALWRVARHIWGWPAPLVAAAILPLAGVDVIFLCANSLKLFDGGYVPLGIGLMLFAVMLTWQWGMGQTRAAYGKHRTMTLAELTRLHRESRQFIERTAILLLPPEAGDGLTEHAPALMLLLWRRNGILPRQIVFVRAIFERQPYIREERFLITDMERNAQGGIMLVEVRFGFMEEPDVGHVLASLARRQLALGGEHRNWVVHTAIEFPNHDRRIGLLRAMRFHLLGLLRLFSLPTYRHYGLGHDVQLSVEILPMRLDCAMPATGSDDDPDRSHQDLRYVLRDHLHF